MNNKRQFLLGIFFIAALSILAFFTLFLTDTVHLFSKPTLETVYFPDAYGLREGDPVLVAGARIGRVKEIVPDVAAPPERRIRTVLTLEQPVELLQGAHIRIKESTLLGGRQIDIDQGVHGAPPYQRGPDGELYGEVEPNPIAALADLGDLFTENRANVAGILEDWRAIAAGVRAGQGTLGRFLVDETLATDLSASVADLRRMTADIDAGQGLLGTLLRDPELVVSVKATVGSLQAVAADLQAGRGIAGRLLYDEELSNEVQRAVDSFADVAERLNRGEGLAGRLLSDPELDAEWDRTLTNFRQVSEDLQAVALQLRSGEGTAGKLVMDQELYDKLLEAVKLLTRSLEDYREAAPISIFTSTLFGAF